MFIVVGVLAEATVKKGSIVKGQALRKYTIGKTFQQDKAMCSAWHKIMRALAANMIKHMCANGNCSSRATGGNAAYLWVRGVGYIHAHMIVSCHRPLPNGATLTKECWKSFGPSPN